MTALSRLTATVLLFATAAAASPPAARSPLGPLARDQWRAAGVDGTGCYCMGRTNGPVRLAMSNDKAVALIAGVTTVLMPARGAKELFPFTFDRWRTPDGSVEITVKKVVGAKRIGTETLESRTDLVLLQYGRRTVLHGTMQCGT